MFLFSTKRRKSFLHDLPSRSITWGYKGLQGGTRDTGNYRELQWVTGDYKGLQGVTRGYKTLQGVTRGYKGFQRVKTGYRGLQRITETFFLATASLDTLSSPPLHKNQSSRNLKFLTKTMD